MYLVRIQNVSAGEAKDAAVRFLPEKDYVLVVVGKAAEIQPLLAKFGTRQEKKIVDRIFKLKLTFVAEYF